MGENAKISWEWHNSDINKGWQANHVIRQPSVQFNPQNIVDMTQRSQDREEKNVKVKHQNNNKSKKDKKKDKKHKKSSTSTDGFNPILQYFASTISDTTRSF